MSKIIKPVQSRTSKRFRLGRRTMLRGLLGGAAGVTLGLPMLESMLDGHGEALADGTAIPKRFGVFYWGGGIVHDAWIPSSTGTGWALPHAFEGWAGLESYLSLVTGMNHKNSSPGHIPARGIALSSSHDLDTSVQGVGTYRGQAHPEPSIDAIVANHYKEETAYKQVNVSICQRGPYKNNSSWEAGGSTYNRHEPKPQQVFDRLFGQGLGGGDDSLLEASLAMESSMLDAVMEDAKRIKQRVGKGDAYRIEQHLEGLRAIEARLQQVEGGGCELPDAPMASNFGDGGTDEKKEMKAHLHADLLAVALACDLTRVFSFEWSATQSEAIYWEFDVTKDHHLLNHDDPTGQHMKDIVQMIMNNFAYLAQAIRSQPVAGGNLLDHTCIFGTSEHARAGSHNYSDHPLVFVGKAGGALRGGVHYRREGSNDDAPKALLTAVRAAGVPQDALGQESNGRRVSETISEIEA